MPGEYDALLKLLATAGGAAALTNPVTAPIGAAMSLIPAAFGAFNAIKMNKQADKIEKNNVDPGFNFSPEVRKNQALAAGAYADKGLPGEDRLKVMIDEKIASTLGNTKGLSNANDFANLAVGLGSQQIDTLGDIAIKGAEQDQLDLQTLMQSNSEANQEFLRGEDYKLNKFMRNAAAASAYRGAAKQSVGNVLGDISKVGLSYFSNNPLIKSPEEVPMQSYTSAPITQTKGLFDVKTEGIDPEIVNLLIQMRKNRKY